MQVALGADERLPIPEHILAYLKEKRHSTTYFGPLQNTTAPWSQATQEVARSVVSGEAEEGILLCWTGTGESIAAKKHPGIRMAVFLDAETARGEWLGNDTNILCFSMRSTTAAFASKILEK